MEKDNTLLEVANSRLALSKRFTKKWIKKVKEWVKDYEIDSLDDIQSEDDAANVVLDGYRKINQNILPEAEALWLLRWEGDSAYNFLKELNLSPANLDFLEDCYNQDWKRDEYHEPEE